MTIKNQKELEILRQGGKKLAAVLIDIANGAKEGVTTKELNNFAEDLITKAGGAPSFKGYKVQGAPNPYPGALCISINEEVVHGLPSDRKFKKGDVVGLDIGMWYEGLCTDTAMTLLVPRGKTSPSSTSDVKSPKTSDVFPGDVEERGKRLINATRKSLEIGIAQVRAGAHVGDIGYAIQNFLEKEKFGVVRELVGHGVGRAVHEDPEIPNFGKRGAGPELIEGMVIALEPMATEGNPKVKIAPDGWTWLTRDGSLAAHFEHTVAVTRDGAEILTRI